MKFLYGCQHNHCTCIGNNLTLRLSKRSEWKSQRKLSTDHFDLCNTETFISQLLLSRSRLIYCKLTIRSSWLHEELTFSIVWSEIDDMVSDVGNVQLVGFKGWETNVIPWQNIAKSVEQRHRKYWNDYNYELLQISNQSKMLGISCHSQQTACTVQINPHFKHMLRVTRCLSCTTKLLLERVTWMPLVWCTFHLMAAKKLLNSIMYVYVCGDVMHYDFDDAEWRNIYLRPTSSTIEKVGNSSSNTVLTGRRICVHMCVSVCACGVHLYTYMYTLTIGVNIGSQQYCVYHTINKCTYSFSRNATSWKHHLFIASSIAACATHF